MLVNLDNLTKNRVSGKLDVEHLKDIHRCLSKDIYFTKEETESAFSGELRITDISNHTLPTISGTSGSGYAEP